MDAYVQELRRGGIVACATETLVGLLADARQPQAVEELCRIKRRPVGEPIALIVPDASHLAQLCASVPAWAQALAERHWPGPLTLVLPARAGLPEPLCPHGSVGVRVPGSSPAQQLVRAFGGALTATSANPSGQPPAATIAQARAYFGDQLAAYVPGDAQGTAPSTVVDATGEQPVVLRQGAILIDTAAGRD